MSIYTTPIRQLPPLRVAWGVYNAAKYGVKAGNVARNYLDKKYNFTNRAANKMFQIKPAPKTLINGVDRLRGVYNRVNNYIKKYK